MCFVHHGKANSLVDVHPELQRSGISRQLIDRVKAMAKEWPVDAIRLDAYDGAAGAGPFYKKCGFKKLGRGGGPPRPGGD